MATTQEDFPNDMEMETLPRCIEYPVENTTDPREAPEINTVAVIPTNAEDREPLEFA